MKKVLTKLLSFFQKRLRRDRYFTPSCVYCRNKTKDGYFDPATNAIVCTLCRDKIYGETAKKRLVPLAPEVTSTKLRIE